MHHLRQRRVRKHRVHEFRLGRLECTGDTVALDQFGDLGPNHVGTEQFTGLFREAAQTRQYAAALAVLVVTEWLYQDWASRAPAKRPENVVHAEWIDLHDYPGFSQFVAFLRAELDRVGPAHRDLVEEFFGRAVDIELAFFDAAYEHPVAVDGAR